MRHSRVSNSVAGRRTVGVIAVFVVSALTLSACASKTTKGGSGSESAVCPAKALEKTTGRTKITMMHSMRVSANERLIDLAERYNEEQDKVTVELVGTDSYVETVTKFRAALPGRKSLPDMVMMEPSSTRFMLDSGVALHAQACIDAEKYDTSDFQPAQLEAYAPGGDLGAMPFNTSVPVLFYNKGIFEKAGLDPNSPPKTLDELRTMSEKIVESGAAEFGFSWRIDASDFEQWLAMSGEDLADNGNGRDGRASKILYDSDGAKELFEWFEGMEDDGLLLPAGRNPSGYDNMLAIGDGNAAMTVFTSAAIGYVLQLIGEGTYSNIDLGVAPLPVAEGPGGFKVDGGALWMMSSSSEAEQAASWDFAKWLSEPAQQAEWHMGTGFIPTRKSVLELPEIVDYWATGPLYRIPVDALFGSPSGPGTSVAIIGAHADAQTELEKAIEAMFAGDLDAAGASKAATDKSNKLIATYEKAVGG